MNLYLVDVATKAALLEVLVHAEDAAAARAYLQRKYPRCELQNVRDLRDVPKHFVVAEGEAARPRARDGNTASRRREGSG